jgi:alpha-D-ribose 1-methylphosphonate 5-triphosphate synthase subunit PhnG
MVRINARIDALLDRSDKSERYMILQHPLRREKMAAQKHRKMDIARCHILRVAHLERVNDMASRNT